MSLKAGNPRRRAADIAFTVSWVVALCAGVSILVVAGVGLGVHGDVGCSVCHSMRPYVDAMAESAHASLECSTCHATPGVAGVMTDGFRAIAWIGGGPPTSSHVSGDVCLDCHEAIAEDTIEARGIAVRHSDFIEVDCGDCHGGTAHAVESRWYRVLEMDDCTTCHRTSGTNPDACSLCHVVDEQEAERRLGTTAWRATHGTGWENTHGMGQLEQCGSCHVPTFCVDCHGVGVPHPTDWLPTHGPETVEVGAEACTTCHDPRFCADCHGVDMPHEEGFLVLHGPRALELSEQTCYRCHNKASCDVCHFESSHPNLPGIGTGHSF